MNAKFIYLLISVFVALSFTACKDDDSSSVTREQKRNMTVNEWIYSEMDIYYYWRERMPSYDKLDNKISPYDFFDKLLAPYNQYTHDGDRFSWIQESYTDLLNQLNGVSSREIGFEYIPYRITGTDNVEFYVAYIKKGTKAEKSGLKRGDIVTKVDGAQLTASNWTGALYQNKAQYKLEGSNFVGTITVEPTENYAENPIYLDSIYSVNDKEIGYIVYNQFTMDKGDDSYSYDKRLAEIFTEYDFRNITDVILDLRYNGGGYNSCAENMASALVPQRDSEKGVFYYMEFNSLLDSYYRKDYGRGYNYVYFTDNIVHYRDNGTTVNISPLPNYGDKIEKLYILVGGNTASASELVINGLLPYMGNKIVLIGETTYGKNVGSYSFSDENNSSNKWGMQPIVFKSYNKSSSSDFGGGFTPGDNIEGIGVNEFDGIEANRVKPLGDKDEILLATAIAKISGTPLPKVLKSGVGQSSDPIGSSFGLKKGAYQMLFDESRLKKQSH